MGKLPRAGASSRCSLFLYSLPPCFCLSLSCSLPLTSSPPLSLSSLLWQCAHSALSVPVFFPPLLIRSLSLSGSSSGEAAVCASVFQLPQVKTAALLDANPTGGGEGAFAALVLSFHPSTGCTFLSISKEASWREGRAEDPGNPTNKSQEDSKEHRLSGTEENHLSEREREERISGIFLNIVTSCLCVFFSFIFCLALTQFLIITFTPCFSSSSFLILFFCGGMCASNR